MSDAPPFKLTRETTIRIDEQGNFWHDGQPVTHPGLAHAFASWVDVDPESGRWILRNDINWCFVTVDDAPLVARSAAVEGDDIVLRLSDGSSERLDAATLRLEPGDVPYCDVRGGRIPARLLPGAAYTVLDWLGERQGEVRRVAAGEGRRRGASG
jgi:uncharacterized protein